MKRLLTVLSALTLLASCTAFGGRVVIDANDGWLMTVGDEPEFADPDLDDSAWKAIAVPSYEKLGKAEGYFWLRARIAVPDALRDGPFWFNTGKVWGAAEIYADGVLIGHRGGMPPDYLMRPGLTSAVLVPANLVRDDATVLIALRCYLQGDTTYFPGFSLLDRAGYAFAHDLQNAFNGMLYVILAAICLFLGIYSVAQFAANPRDRSFLFFSLSLIFMSLYFYDLGAERFVPSGLVFRATARAALTASIGCLILFFMRFFTVCDRRPLRIGIAVHMAVMAVAFLANSRSESRLDAVFNVGLIPIFAGIIFGVIIVVVAARKGNPDALPVVVGLLLGIGFGIHDIVYQINKVTPFAWLQGLTFFAINMSVFVSMSWRTVRFQRDLARNTAEVLSQRDRLTGLFAEISRQVSETRGVAERLETAVVGVSDAAERSADSGTAIVTTVERQTDALSGARGAVDGLLGSIEKVDAELETESAKLRDGMGRIAELLGGVELVVRKIEDTAALSESLREVGERGEREIAQLRSAIDKVGTSSTEIREIVEVVNDLAERTNMLAMNASIEAAHAGQFGKGFTIIAQEIKKLAQASAGRAAMIVEIMTSVDGIVEEVAKAASRASEALSSMITRTADAAETIRRIARDAEDTKRQGATAQDALNDIGESSNRVKGESARQGDYSAQVRLAMATLLDSTKDVKESSSDIMRRDRELVGQATALRELAGSSRSIAEALSALMKRE